MRVAGLTIRTGVVVIFNQDDIGLGRAFPRACEGRFKRSALSVDDRGELLVAKRVGGIGQDLRFGQQALVGIVALAVLAAGIWPEPLLAFSDAAVRALLEGRP